MSNNSQPYQLFRTGQGNTFPVTGCYFKCTTACPNTTNHYCLRPDPYGTLLLDGQRICGKSFCMICATSCGYENHHRCPQCDENSNMVVRRSPRRSNKNENTASATSGSNSTTAQINPTVLDFNSPGYNWTELQGNSQNNKNNINSASRKSSDSADEECGTPNVKSTTELMQLVERCEDLFTDDKTFFNDLQDPGEPMADGASRCKNDYWRPKGINIQYRVLKKAGKEFLDRIKSKPEYFPKIPSNGKVYHLCNVVCNWFLKHRATKLTKRKEMSQRSHPLHWDFVKDDVDMDREYYLVDQRFFLGLAVSLWGNTEEKAKRVYSNDDFIRVIGILLHEEFRDGLDIILDNRKSREVIDDRVNMSKKACWEVVKTRFVNKNVVISNPPSWHRALSLHGDPGLDANNPERIELPWTSDEIQTMFNTVMKKYRAAMKNWTKGTGGGPGFPENYNDWQARDEAEYFHGYATPQGAGLELTWMYMYDKRLNFPLLATFVGLPDNARLEGGVVRESGSLNDRNGVTLSNTKGRRKIASDHHILSEASATISSISGGLKEIIESGILTENKEDSAKAQTTKRELSHVIKDLHSVNVLLEDAKKKHSAAIKSMTDDDMRVHEKQIKKMRKDIKIFMSGKNKLMSEMKKLNEEENDDDVDDDDVDFEMRNL